MKYTKKQFLNLNNPDNFQKIICEAKIVRKQFIAFTRNKYISHIHIDDSSTCKYKIIYKQDLNEDGKVNDLDKYFFLNGSAEKMAWIPLEHFSFITKVKDK